MAITVEEYVGGRKVSYDMVKFHRNLIDALVNKGILTKQELEMLYKKSQ